MTQYAFVVANHCHHHQQCFTVCLLHKSSSLNDSTRPTGDPWRRAVDRGHVGAMTGTALTRYANRMMILQSRTQVHYKRLLADILVVQPSQNVGKHTHTATAQ